MRLIHYNETEAADGEEETAGQSLHYILAVDAVWHKCNLRCVKIRILLSFRKCMRHAVESFSLTCHTHRPGMTVLICGRANAGRLNNDIVDDA